MVVKQQSAYTFSEVGNGRHEPPAVAFVGSSSDDIVQDKFLVQTYTFDSKSGVPDEGRLPSFWKGLPHSAIKEHRYSVQSHSL